MPTPRDIPRRPAWRQEIVRHHAHRTTAQAKQTALAVALDSDHPGRESKATDDTTTKRP